MNSIPKASDLPAGSVVATDDLAGIKSGREPRFGGPWDMTNGARYWDKHLDEMLAEGAQVLRVGLDVPAPVLVVDEGRELAEPPSKADLDALYRAGRRPGLSIDRDEAIRSALQLIGVEDTEENRAKVAAIPAKVAAILNPPPAVLDALSTDPDDSAPLAYVEIPVDEDTARALHEHQQSGDPQLPPDLAASLRRGLAQSAAGDTVDLGDFTQYADTPAWIALGGGKFHTRETCRHLAASRSEITVERARALGLDLCSSCELASCTCVESCADDPETACSLSGIPHVHPDDGSGTFGPCPVHPDRPGDH